MSRCSAHHNVDLRSINYRLYHLTRYSEHKIIVETIDYCSIVTYCDTDLTLFTSLNVVTVDSLRLEPVVFVSKCPLTK